MRVYCTACGAAHEGEPGGKVDCSSCAATFAIPLDLVDAPRTLPAAAEPPDLVVSSSSPPPARRAPRAELDAPRSGNNAWAVASFVSGLLCCIPLLSPLGGLLFGTIALQQIKERPSESGRNLAIGGIILGSVSGVLSLLWVIGNASR